MRSYHHRGARTRPQYICLAINGDSASERERVIPSRPRLRPPGYREREGLTVGAALALVGVGTGAGVAFPRVGVGTGAGAAAHGAEAGTAARVAAEAPAGLAVGFAAPFPATVAVAVGVTDGAAGPGVAVSCPTAAALAAGWPGPDWAGTAPAEPAAADAA